MSSRYVRNLVRDWLADLATPFYDTINRDQNPPDKAWITLEFDVARTDALTFCAGIERGTFLVVYVGSVGTGDDFLTARIEQDIPQLMARIDPDGLLALIEASPPEEMTDGDGSPYMLGISIDYEYQAQ